MSNVKYYPILFSTPMVQGILEGKKTQTRRTKGLEAINENPDEWKFDGIGTIVSFPASKKDFKIHYCFINPKTGGKRNIFCPYEVGDVLWVRETFRSIEQDVGLPRFEYKATENVNLTDKWKPSLFMPKKACRIFLKLKSIRAERLQNISEEDSIAEGAKDRLRHSDLKFLEGLGDWTIPSPFGSHQFGFLAIWCTINGCENWLKNPFVWVYEFERIEKPNDFI